MSPAFRRSAIAGLSPFALLFVPMPLPTTFVLGSTAKVMSLPADVTVSEVADTDLTVVFGAIWFFGFAWAAAVAGRATSETATARAAHTTNVLILTS